jgi:uncharacterized membrane protein
MKMANPGPSFQNGTSVIAAMHPVGQAFTVTLRATECSDGMSDRVYPLEAEILQKGRNPERLRQQRGRPGRPPETLTQD